MPLIIILKHLHCSPGKITMWSPLPLILHTLTKADMDWEGHAVIPDQKIIMRYIAS